MTKKAKKHPKLNKAIDTFISALKIAGSSDLFLGIFIILEGLSLIFVPTLFPIFIALSILIAFAFAVELFFDLARRKRTVRSVLQQVCIGLILAILILYCFLMIFDDLFRLNVDRVLVCATTIADGIKNLIKTIKIEKQTTPRIIFVILSLIYINYGIVYCFLGGETNFFTTTMHGIVFIFCGLTDIWTYLRNPKNKRRVKKLFKR